MGFASSQYRHSSVSAHAGSWLASAFIWLRGSGWPVHLLRVSDGSATGTWVGLGLGLGLGLGFGLGLGLGLGLGFGFGFGLGLGIGIGLEFGWS